MSRIDLNIVDRGAEGTKWAAEDIALTADSLDKVVEQKTDNCAALNSLPTPFARFFVAREAFRRVMEENIDQSKEAGLAYTQMVSDILDVYELLFYLRYHKNNTWRSGEKIELREWDFHDNMEIIKKKMPILYNSVEEYYKSDIVEDKLYFLIYTENGREMLLACSSPMTGFVTPPDLDKAIIKKEGVKSQEFVGEQYKSLHIRRKSGGEYFREPKSFIDREEDFKNYMYNTLFGTGNTDARFKTIRDFIRSFKDKDESIRNDRNPKTVSVKTDQNDDLVINGLNIRQLDEVDVNYYFTDNLIRIPYRISKDTFMSVTYQNDPSNREYDYLMPLKHDVVKDLFPDGIIDADIHINRNYVTAHLRYNGKEYEKEYAVEPFRDGQGRIVDLQKAKISFDLGLFPNILSYKEQENNYFKILVVAADEDPEAPHFNIDQISLSFFKDGKQIGEVEPEQGASYGACPAVVRSRQKTDSEESGTKFYELFNTSFDLIEVKVLGNTGLLRPIWQTSQATDVTFTYAIDLGTSNTFMSRCKNDSNGKPDLSRKPDLFKMEHPMVSFMHEVPDNDQFSLASRIEDSIFTKAKNRIKTEFIPPIIDGDSYKFPIRTALCGIHNKSQIPRLFDNHNIAFFYERMLSNDDQDVHTDIKWDKNEDLLRIFVRELLLIIKCDILQRNGDLDRTNLVWFSPLSFSGNEKAIYNDIWTSEPRDILFIEPGQIRQYSESEAPYYYYKKKDYIKDSETVTVIDIGGGSTDFVYFKDNKPMVANSVHFGCDVLWGNGFIEFQNERENGIYKRYAENLRFNRKDLEDLNDNYKNVESLKTKDIINFWLSNSDYCNITKYLREDFKPVFIYHLTSILYYMASMYKDNNLKAPRTVVFSGNGSKYIDNFISTDNKALKSIIDLIFKRVFGEESNVNLKLPEERKESTCYGGLYRDPNEENVKDIVYQGDTTVKYQKVSDISNNFDSLKSVLLGKYEELNELYKAVLDKLQQERIIDSMADTSKYTKEAKKDMGTPLTTYYKSQVKEKYSDEVFYNDSVFFLPVINRIFELTKI